MNQYTTYGEAVRMALDAGHTHYTSRFGRHELRVDPWDPQWNASGWTFDGTRIFNHYHSYECS